MKNILIALLAVALIISLTAGAKVKATGSAKTRDYEIKEILTINPNIDYIVNGVTYQVKTVKYYAVEGRTGEYFVVLWDKNNNKIPYPLSVKATTILVMDEFEQTIYNGATK